MFDLLFEEKNESNKTTLNHVSKIGNDFRTLLNDKITADTVILIENKSIYAHRIFLARSKIFASLLTYPKPQIEIKDYKYDDFLEFLTFLYQASCNITDENFLPLAKLAHEHGIDELKFLCLEYLVRKIDKESAVRMIMQAESGEFDIFGPDLVKKCASVIADEAEEIFNSEGFLSLSEKSLIALLENDALNIEEIQIFNNVLRWGKHKAEQSKRTLNDVLKNIIPVIRYPLISPNDLRTIVKPSGLVPEELYMEALEAIISPPLMTESEQNVRLRDRGGSAGLRWNNGRKDFSYNGSVWSTMLGTQLKVKKRYKWSIKITSFHPNANTWGMIIGVATPQQQLNTYLGNSSFGWGYVALNGKKNHCSGQGQNYGRTFGNGDVITVIYDGRKGTLEFLVNGKSQGIAFNNVPFPVCPAISYTAPCTGTFC